MELKVSGMMCEHCKKRVTDAVLGVAGVKEVVVDLKKKTVKVKGDAEESAVVAAITAAGYEAEGR